MQSLRRRSSSSVEIELVPSLIRIQHLIEVPVQIKIHKGHNFLHAHQRNCIAKPSNTSLEPVCEEYAAAEEDVGLTRSEPLNAIDQRIVESLAAELVYELVVVDFAAVFGGDFPWIHHLLR